MRKTLAIVALLVPAISFADTSIQLGTKWYFTKRSFEGANIVTAIPPAGAGGVDAGADGLPMSHLLEDINGNFGIGIGDSAVVMLGLDIGRWGQSMQARETPGDTTSAIKQFDASVFRFGLAPALKLYFSDRNPGHISPYFYAEFFKYITSVSSTNVIGDNSTLLLAYIGDRLSPIGGSAALGCEYNFSRNFSIGADIIGLRFAHTGFTSPKGIGYGGQADTALVGSSNEFTWYTTINLNFRIFGLFQVYTKEDDRPEPARIGGSEAPPPPPPPGR